MIIFNGDYQDRFWLTTFPPFYVCLFKYVLTIRVDITNNFLHSHNGSRTKGKVVTLEKLSIAQKKLLLFECFNA